MLNNRRLIFIIVLAFITFLYTFLGAKFIGPYLGIHMNLTATHNPATPTDVSATTPSCILTSTSRYGFDCGPSGWEKTSFFEGQAVRSLTTTQFTNQNGISSQVLAVTVDFTGPIKARKADFRESGEVLVDLDSFPPLGFATSSVDLHDRTVSAWVWVPEEGMGILPALNGFQLFVKDKNNKNCYGAWSNITQEKVWFRVLWEEKKAALCDTDFDSSQPKFLGIKIALGTDSIKIYNEPLTIYIDDINWE